MSRTTRTTRNRWLAGGGGILAAAAVLAVTAAPAQAAPLPRGTTQVSVGPNGAAPDNLSTTQGISANGRYALFTSRATNLVAQPATGGSDAYVRDLRTGRTERVSLSDSGEAVAGWTDQAAISGNGRYVAFESNAEDVVPGMQVKGRTEVYVRDRQTGRTELISGGLTVTDTDRYHYSYAPSISANGRYVAYVSSRTDLDPTVVDPEPETEPGTAPSLARPYTWKINVHLTDRWTHTTRLVTRDVHGKPGESTSFRPKISADGRTIGFGSISNLLPDEQAPGLAAATTAAAAAPADVDLTPSAAEASRQNVPQNAAQPTLARPNAAPYYTYDVRSGKITAVSAGLDGQIGSASFEATISPDGRHAVYTLAEPGGSTGGHRSHTVLYVRDLKKGTVTKVSGGLPGTSSVGSSDHGSITADNRWIYFESAADNLVAGPQHPGWDVYRQDLRTGRTERISTAPDGSFGNGSSRDPVVAASGRTVLFDSTSGNLVAGADGPAAEENTQVFAKPAGRHQGLDAAQDDDGQDDDGQGDDQGDGQGEGWDD
ncbi:PD40 domain-containing protein [Kitasatospora sp. MY 5-36]|uniref:TolB family protein n=1 Tax=Kitasatospora sp. MY 5-36 TaxID=1678027 RepID=UPI0006712C6D|nr:PD40 domain-containing protein [Kitasatospora sp. MY 5-36]